MALRLEVARYVLTFIKKCRISGLNIRYGKNLPPPTYRTKVSDHADPLNERQLKVLNRLIDYELRDGFECGMNNAKYQKMAGISDRAALRDLNELISCDLMVKEGQLKRHSVLFECVSLR